jgi:hypothetical protein
MKAFIVRSLLVVVSFVLLVQLWIFASLAWWRYKPVETTMFMRIDYWSEPSKPIQHEWRDYDEISEYMKKAIVAAEDGKFMQHHGFDWDGIQAALERNNDTGKVVAGGSTISQQLAKNLFLYNKRSFIRKGQEAIATWMMERMWSKESLFLVCNKSDIASQAKSLDDLDLSRLMLLEEGHCLRDHTLSACPIGERKNDHRLKASSLPTLVEMVSADLGFTLLPEIAIHTNMIKANPDLMVKQIEAAPSRILALVTRKSTPLQSEFDVLLQILQKITQDLH